MKFGKVLTYKDVREAEDLIGKKVAVSPTLKRIEEHPEVCIVTTLNGVSREGLFPFIFDDEGNTAYVQFIREVKEEKTYRPFRDIDELVAYWDKHYTDKKRPKGTMPFIWVSVRETKCIGLVRCYDYECNRVVIFASSISLETLRDDFEFLDGHPCGVEE